MPSSTRRHSWHRLAQLERHRRNIITRMPRTRSRENAEKFSIRAKSKEDARWLADVFVRKMLKSAGEGETEEDIITVSAARLSALRERLMGGGGVSTSVSAQHHNNPRMNGRGNSLGRGSSNSLGGVRGMYQGRGGGRGNQHVSSTSRSSQQHQHHQHQQQSNEVSSSTTTQESSFTAMFQPAFRPYVCVLETADSARFSAAVSRSLADALKALIKKLRDVCEEREKEMTWTKDPKKRTMLCVHSG